MDFIVLTSNNNFANFDKHQITDNETPSSLPEPHLMLRMRPF